MSPYAMPAEGGKRPRMPRAPTQAVYDAMTPEQRERMELEIMEALDELRVWMSEGTPHSRPKNRALAELEAHFRRRERRIFLATELAVLYPGEEVFVPDITAIRDVDPDYEVNTWMVARERRGIDLALEIHNLGRKHKDVEENVREYARLGVPEYFAFEVQTRRLRGFRLASAGRSYVPIVAQGGRLPSAVLGLELAVEAGRLRFFDEVGPVPGTTEMVERLDRMAAALVEERRRADAEARRADEERRRADEERRRADAAEAQLRELLGRLRGPN